MGSIGGKFPRGYLRKLSSDFEDTKQAAITASMEDAQSKMDVLSSSFGTEFEFFDNQLTNVSSSFVCPHEPSSQIIFPGKHMPAIKVPAGPE